MWAPGAYISQGRVTLPAPNIGIEKYFFKVADTILSHIKSSRGTVILPQRAGPIADALYSAAGNSADENWYKRGIIAYSFEAGAQRITVNPTTGAITRTAVGFQPCFGGPGTQGGQGAAAPTATAGASLIVNEGHDSTMEFAEGNFGEIQGALDYLNDVTPPATTIEYAAAADVSGAPIHFKFNWVAEPSVIFYTTGRHGADRDHGQPGDRRRRGLRQPARRRLDALLQQPGRAPSGRGADARDSGRLHRQVVVGRHEGQRGAGQDAAAPGGGGRRVRHAERHRAARRSSLTLGPAASFPPFTPGVDQTYNARDHGERDLDRR